MRSTLPRTTFARGGPSPSAKSGDRTFPSARTSSGPARGRLGTRDRTEEGQGLAGERVAHNRAGLVDPPRFAGKDLPHPDQLIASCQFVMPSFHFLVSATAGRENRGILPSDRTTTPRPIRPLRRVGTSCSTRCTSQSWTDRLRRPPPHFHPIGSRRTRQVPATPPSPHNTLES